MGTYILVYLIYLGRIINWYIRQFFFLFVAQHIFLFVFHVIKKSALLVKN